MVDDDDQTQKRPGLPLDPGRVWISSRRGWRLLPLGALSGIVLGWVIAAPLGDSFRSRSVLVWEPHDKTGRAGVDLTTQAAMLELPSVLDAAGRRIDLDVPAAQLSQRVAVSFDTQSSLVTVEAAGRTASEAVALVDALVEAFLEHQTELARARAAESLASLEADVNAAQAAVDEAQAAYDAFRRRHDVVDPAVEVTQALATVTSLRQSTQTSFDPGFAGTSRSLADAKAELGSARARLADDHPTVAILESRVRVLSQQEQEAAARQAQRHARMLGAAEGHLTALSGIESQARELSSKVEQSRSFLEELRHQALGWRRAVRTPTVDFRVLSSGSSSVRADASEERRLVAGLAIAGLLCALAFLVLRPMHGARVHTAREAAFWSKLPVVASTVWPSRPDLFSPFVDELADAAARAEGAMLILGDGEEEGRLADQIARVLNPAQYGPSTASAGRLPAHGVPKEALRERLAGAHTMVRTARVDGLGDGVGRPPPIAVYAWRGLPNDPSVRRAVRIADRVIVVVRSGSESIPRLATLRNRLGRDHGVALVLVDVPEALIDLPDRAGDVEGFWRFVATEVDSPWPDHSTVNVISA